MQIDVRRATIADTDVLASLGRRTFFDTFAGTCTDADMTNFLEAYFNQQQVTAELSNPDDYFYLAEQDGIAVGYMRLMEDYSAFPLMTQWKALELKRIYISKTHHGKGVAQLLITFAESFATQHGYEVLWLGVWEHNSRAKRFYQKCGFEDSGHTHDFPIGNTPQTDQWLWKFLK